MLTTSVIEKTNIVTLDFGGGLDVEDEQQLRDALDPVIAQHGSARLLASIGEIDLGRVEPKAAWMDLKAAGYVDKIDRVAVVSDAGWLTKISEWAGELTSMTLQTFPAAERDQAMAWLTEG